MMFADDIVTCRGGAVKFIKIFHVHEATLKVNIPGVEVVKVEDVFRVLTAGRRRW